MAATQKFTIDMGAAGQRLDKFLTEKIQNTSRSQIQKMISRGQVTINKTQPTKHHFLRINDVISIDLNTKITAPDDSILPKIDIILVNDDYLIIDKLANLVVHADQVHPLEKTLAGWLLKKYPEIKGVAMTPIDPA